MQSTRGAWCLSSFVVASTLCVMGCGDEVPEISQNLRGSVFVAGDIVNVEVEVRDAAGEESNTTTDDDGEYGFTVIPGPAEVRLSGGLPSNVECTPGLTQSVDIPVFGFVEANFTCETAGGGG